MDGGSSPPPTLRKAYREKEGVLGVLTAVLMKQGRFVRSCLVSCNSSPLMMAPYHQASRPIDFGLCMYFGQKSAKF